MEVCAVIIEPTCGRKMTHRVCPWWLGYWLICPVRRFWHSPHELLAPYVQAGMTALEPGPGMGYFTLELARLVGPSGRVIAADVQPKMVDRLQRRAAKAGLLGRLEARVAPAESMGIPDLQGSVDFTLAFAVVHEFPDAGRFFAEVATASKAGASVLLAEPSGHVKADAFDSELQAAASTGLSLVDRPSIRRSQTALLKKG
ncbi:MAG: methyltransferase domain-containing protein [Candidatus Korobacteraceae bacterium]|jgi:ubiquinone/menaquinone biosynthesis C-methylase UbiE